MMIMHTVHSTSHNVADVTESNSLLRGQESCVFVDAGYLSSD